MLPDDGLRPATRMAAALRELPGQPVANEIRRGAMLDGLERIACRVAPWLRSASGVRELRRSCA
jgi:hypothetical protein